MRKTEQFPMNTGSWATLLRKIIQAERQDKSREISNTKGPHILKLKFYSYQNKHVKIWKSYYVRQDQWWQTLETSTQTAAKTHLPQVITLQSNLSDNSHTDIFCLKSKPAIGMPEVRHHCHDVRSSLHRGEHTNPKVKWQVAFPSHTPRSPQQFLGFQS